jgi:hypothetical protein
VGRGLHSALGMLKATPPPNMALQRTRRPRIGSGRSLRLLGSPLNAQPLGRLFRIFPLLYLGVGVPLEGRGDAPAGRVLRWASDVRPALESVICVTPEERDGNRFFQPSISEPPECPGPLPSDPLLAQVARLMNARGVLMRAKVGSPLKAFEGIPVDLDHRAAAQESYRAMVLSNPDVQRRLMPRIHEVLASAGAACSDCPGPKQLPTPRGVRYSELMPYVLAYLWPVKVGADGGVSMQICAGTNGIQEMKTPDPSLVDAGFELIFGNWEAIGKATRKAKDAARSPECQKLDSEARVAYVRRYLAETLPADTVFREALRPGIRILPEIGLTCLDCS